jgi:hypothetical protein
VEENNEVYASQKPNMRFNDMIRSTQKATVNLKGHLTVQLIEDRWELKLQLDGNDDRCMPRTPLSASLGALPKQEKPKQMRSATSRKRGRTARKYGSSGSEKIHL